MFTPPPASAVLPPALSGLRDFFTGLATPPDWLVDEVQNRVVLFLNHVLNGEDSARDRLVRQQGRVVHIRWAQLTLFLEATPAGLLRRAAASKAADLTLEITDTAPLDIARNALQGTKPAVRIEGDVQLAAEVNWLVDHVRWDIEEDLSRFLGDGPARALSVAVGRALQLLRSQAASARTASPPQAPAA